MEALVVGAGVVGLAVARALALRGHAVVVAEAASAIGTGTSSRNSEVMHAGLYDPTGSLRARHCLEGRRRLEAYCATHGVPHRRCGKLVVATRPEECEALAILHARGTANGVERLDLLEGDAARRLEPNLACVMALHVPVTGILDGHALMRALQGDLEDAGSVVALRTPVTAIDERNGGWTVAFGGRDPGSLAVDVVVNAAGLGAQELASRVAGYPAAQVPPLVLAKGHYFACTAQPAFTRLIYPVPVPGGLGIHLTLDLAGRMRFGPDVAWVEAVDYTVDPERAPAFATAVRRYWPGLPDGALVPDYAGVRPKLTGPDQRAADFRIDGPDVHGRPGLVHLFGIESPGLTAALSLAEEVADRLAA